MLRPPGQRRRRQLRLRGPGLRDDAALRAGGARRARRRLQPGLDGAVRRLGDDDLLRRRRDRLLDGRAFRLHRAPPGPTSPHNGRVTIVPLPQAECAPIYLDFMDNCGDMLAQTPLVGPQYTALQEKCQAVAPGGDKDGLSETGGKPAPPWIFTRRRQIFFVAPTLNFKMGMRWPRICHRERRVRHELGGVDYDGVRPDGGTARAGRGPRRPWRRRYGPVPHTLLRHAPALRCSSAPLLPALSRIPRSDKKCFVSFGLFATRSRKDSLVVPIGYEVLP